MSFTYAKQPFECEIIAVDFSRRIPAGVTISPVSTAVTYVQVEETIAPANTSASDYNGHLVISSTTLVGIAGREKILAAKISAGVSSFSYRVTFRITLSDGQKKEEDVLVTIKET